MPTEKEIMDDADEVKLTVDQVRKGSEVDIYNALSDALDNAQAPVFMGEQSHAYVIIKIVK